MNHVSLPHWLHAFFHEWLGEQRNCSRHTVLSYRDTWRLYLRFVAGRRRRPVSALTLAELTADEVLAFLRHIESERRASIGTRNCRLAAIRSFYRFVADVSRWRPCNARRYCASRSRRGHGQRSRTSTARKSPRSSINRIARRSKGSGIKRSWPSFTTPARASKRRWIFARAASGSRPRRR